MKSSRRLKLSAGLSLVLLGLLSGVLVSTPATAGPVTFHFSGVVTSVSPALNPPFNPTPAPETTLSGDYTFETLTFDSRPALNRGLYYGAITGLNVILTGPGLVSYTATLGNSGTNFIDIRNGPVAGAADRYDLQAPLTAVSPVVPPGLPRNEFSPLRFRIELTGPGIVSDASLSSTPPSISSLTPANRVWRVVFEDSSGRARLRGFITSIVPLPAAVILFGAGLVALAGLGAGSWRQRNNSIA